MGPSQLSEVLRLLPIQSHPQLLVGLDSFDDAAIFKISESEALVQTLDFLTPIVDDPYAYGAIAAANSLSDVYAMGGKPLTVMNIACFDPTIGDPSIWAKVLQGAYDKTIESGAVVVGGHTVKDNQPKFGLSVTGIVHPEHILTNKNAQPGQKIWISKPLGTGIMSTAFKEDKITENELKPIVDSMMKLNKDACESAHLVGAKCATDITGFGLAGHLYNIARGSDVTLMIFAEKVPIFDRIQEMVELGCMTGGSKSNCNYLAENLVFSPNVPEWLHQVILDPQTSGGLVVVSDQEPKGYTYIGEALEGPSKILVD